MSGKLCETDAMESIDAVCPSLPGRSLNWRQIEQTGVLQQPTEDDDSQICQRLQDRASRISTIGDKPDFALDVQRTNRLHEPCHEIYRQFELCAEVSAIFLFQRRHVLLTHIQQ